MAEAENGGGDVSTARRIEMGGVELDQSRLDSRLLARRCQEAGEDERADEVRGGARSRRTYPIRVDCLSAPTQRWNHPRQTLEQSSAPITNPALT